MRLEPDCRHAHCPQDRAIIRHLFSVARRIAGDAGLDYHRREDFAGQFAALMLCHRRQDLRRYQQRLPEAWLRTCALHSLLNYRRAEATIRSHETQWPQTEDLEGVLIDVEFAVTGPSPDALLLRRELRQRIEAAIDSLEPRTADLLRQSILEGKTITELAEAARCDYDALRMRLTRARHRVISQLQRSGLDESEAIDCLREIIRCDTCLGGISNDSACPPIAMLKAVSTKKMMALAKSPVRFCRFELLYKVAIPVPSSKRTNITALEWKDYNEEKQVALLPFFSVYWQHFIGITGNEFCRNGFVGVGLPGW